jgi:serine/threonine-protein kinase
MADGDKTLTEGELFGSYQIVRALGAGAFGVVYEALRQPLGKRVALKVLRTQLTSRTDVMQRFLREAQMTAQIRHPHVVETFDVGAQDGAPYLAMEFLEGEPLSKRIAREKKLTVEAALDVMIPVFSAMATVHDHGVVHRDLKPDNIFLVRRRGTQVFPKVLDFGIAKAGLQNDGMALTRTSSLLGTPYYMSPEQSRESKHIDARSDQWALGVILYECLTGARPFTGESLLELLTNIAGAKFAPPAELCPDAPPGVVAVLERMLRVDPAQRFPDTRAVALALLPFASPATRAQWTEDLTESPAVHAPGAPSASNPSGTLAGPASGERRPLYVGSEASDAPPPPAPGTLTLAPHESASLQAERVRPVSAPRGRAWIIPAAAAVAIALVAVGGWVSLRKDEPAASVASVTAPARRVAPARFRVRARVVPETAALVLDQEAPVTGSLDRELVRDGQAHRLVATAPGYRRAEFEFRDEFASPEIVLVREEPAPVVAQNTPTPTEATPEAPTDRPRRRRSRRSERSGESSAETGANGVTIR